MLKYLMRLGVLATALVLCGCGTPVTVRSGNGDDLWWSVFEEDLSKVAFRKHASTDTPVADNWIIQHGPWESSPDGIHKANQDAEGVILCRMPVLRNAVRIEYEARSSNPGDLSILLGTRPGVKPYSSGAVFFGFGMNANKRSKIIKPGGDQVESTEPEALIVPDKWHKVVVERSGGRLIMAVDGKRILETEDRPEGFESPYIAFYGWHAGHYRRLKVLTRPDALLETFLTPEARKREASWPKTKLTIKPLAGIFTDHMVLQRGVKLPVWGWTEAGNQVSVEFDDNKREAVADKDGKWTVWFPPMDAGGPHVMTVRADGVMQLNDIYVGDVWIASGQSNMQWPLSRSINAEDEVKAASFPLIRFYRAHSPGMTEPVRNVTGEWRPVTPLSAGPNSAVGYFFARHVHQQIKVPIGIIQNAVGGKPAEAYTSWEMLMGIESLKEDMTARRARFLKEKKEKGLKGRIVNSSAPAALWNALVAPVLPYAIKGVVWYQGESNAGRPVQYRALFPLMIECWRQAWGQGDFPFLFVQLANYQAVSANPQESHWAELREAQTMALALPNTGMALAIDIGEADDIHPRNKQDVGLRLGLAAEKIAYERDLVHSGPQFEKVEAEGTKLRIDFTHCGSGLEARGGELTFFSIAGPNGKYVWAQARIDGDSVLVWHDRITQPIKVRYAWADNPEGANLYNKEGLPAVPFQAEVALPDFKPAGDGDDVIIIIE